MSERTNDPRNGPSDDPRDNPRRDRPARERGANAADLLAVARLGRPHGLRGEARVWMTCPEPLRTGDWMLGREFRLRLEGSEIGRARIEGIRPHGDAHLVKLEGRGDRDAIQELKNVELCLRRRDLPELPGGWIWEDALVGLPVFDARLGEIGRTAGLDEIGGRWSLRVERGEGGAAVSIPWTGGLVRAVDLEGGRIDVELPLDYPGLS